MEGFIRRAMETMAASAMAGGGDGGSGDDNDDNVTITMVINLDLHTMGVQGYVARLNLTGVLDTGFTTKPYHTCDLA